MMLSAGSSVAYDFISDTPTHCLAPPLPAGMPNEDALTQSLITRLVANPSLLESCPAPFDEGLLWRRSALGAGQGTRCRCRAHAMV